MQLLCSENIIFKKRRLAEWGSFAKKNVTFSLDFFLVLSNAYQAATGLRASSTFHLNMVGLTVSQIIQRHYILRSAPFQIVNPKVTLPAMWIVKPFFRKILFFLSYDAPNCAPMLVV